MRLPKWLRPGQRTKRGRRTAKRPRVRLRLEVLEDRAVPAGLFDNAVLLDPFNESQPVYLVESISLVGEVDYYEVPVSLGADPVLQIDVHGQDGFDPQVALYAPWGEMLVLSDDVSATSRDGHIVQNVRDSFYYLAVSASPGTVPAVGNYELSVKLIHSSPPFGVGPLYGSPIITTGDFNEDHIEDVLTMDETAVWTMASFGNGTFQDVEYYSEIPNALHDALGIVSGDFNQDNHLDAVALGSNGLVVLLGRGDGLFDLAQELPMEIAQALTVADFDRDGDPELAVTRSVIGQDGLVSGLLSILAWTDTEVFEVKQQLSVTGSTTTPVELISPNAVAVGDFNGDGHVDVATGNFYPGSVSLFFGNGDGTLANEQAISVTTNPQRLQVADFDGDGLDDVAALASQEGRPVISILYGVAGGGFAAERRQVLATDLNAQTFTAGDFNSDGRADLAVLTEEPGLILLGQADRTLQEGSRFIEEGFDDSFARQTVVQGDFNDDGRDDLAVSGADGKLVFFLGRGDGTFQRDRRLMVGAGQEQMVQGDFNGDGRIDLATANAQSDDISLLIGLGDGTFAPEKRLPVGDDPLAIVTGDFNGDGRLDLAVTYGSELDAPNASILLGLGDGRFESERRFDIGGVPASRPSLAAADFNGDGRDDLATANTASDEVRLFLATGDGGFGEPVLLLAPGMIYSGLTTGDFNGDGREDLAVSVIRGNGIDVKWIFLNQADGTFTRLEQPPIGNPDEPVQYYGSFVGDFNEDGRDDLVGRSEILLAQEDGTFVGGPSFRGLGYTPNPTFFVDAFNTATAVGDFNADGHLDLATRQTIRTRTHNSEEVFQRFILLHGRGDGGFEAGPVFWSQEYFLEANSMVAADFNNDGALDVAGTPGIQYDVLYDDVTILLGDSNGGFFDGRAAPSNRFRATPLAADVTGDGTKDVIVLSATGDILVRRGRSAEPGTFDPPVVANPGRGARTITLVPSATGNRIGAVDREGNAVSIYTIGPTGVVIDRQIINEVPLPLRVASADLNGDGLPDLVISRAVANEVFVAFGNADGSFTGQFFLLAGTGSADIAFGNLDSAGGIDLVLANQLSGDVSVLLNPGDGSFENSEEILDEELRFRAGLGAYGIVLTPPSIGGRSREETSGLAIEDINLDGVPDVVVTNRGSNTISLLTGKGNGNLRHPKRFLTGSGPTVIHTAHFNHDVYPDVAVLNEQGSDISIFLGNASGGLDRVFTAQAGNLPSDFTIADVDGDGDADLVVGNEFGDVLTLLGNGDGTFQAYQRVDRDIALAVADLDGDGQDDFIFGNQAMDRVAIQFGGAAPQEFQGRDEGILAPGAVKLHDLNQDGQQDLIVANGGANNLLVYLGQGGGQFEAAKTFFTGTNPVGFSVGDIDGNDVPDVVVANKGSNDLTLLLGQNSEAGWTMKSGLRLDSGGTGPVGLIITDQNSDGIADLLVSNSQSNNAAVLPGLGNGFFNDFSPITFDLPGAPTAPVLSGFADSTIFIPVQTANVIALLSLTGLTFVDSGGIDPVAASPVDFDADGFTDLVVAHDNGVISLLLGGPTGLSLAEILETEFAHFSDMVLAGQAGSVLTLYLSLEGQEGVLTFAFDLDAPLPTLPDSAPSQPGGLPGADVGSGSNRPQFAGLTELDEGGLTVVAVLLTGGASSEDFTQQGENEYATGEEGEQEEMKEEQQPPPTTPPGEETSAFDQFIIGLDEFGEQINQWIQQEWGQTPPSMPKDPEVSVETSHGNWNEAILPTDNADIEDEPALDARPISPISEALLIACFTSGACQLRADSRRSRTTRSTRSHKQMC